MPMVQQGALQRMHDHDETKARIEWQMTTCAGAALLTSLSYVTC